MSERAGWYANRRDRGFASEGSARLANTGKYRQSASIARLDETVALYSWILASHSHDPFPDDCLCEVTQSACAAVRESHLDPCCVCDGVHNPDLSGRQTPSHSPRPRTSCGNPHRPGIVASFQGQRDLQTQPRRPLFL